MSEVELVIALTMRREQLETKKAKCIKDMYPDGPDTIGDGVSYDEFLQLGYYEGRLKMIDEILNLIS